MPKLIDVTDGAWAFLAIAAGSAVWNSAVLSSNSMSSQLAQWASKWALVSHAWRLPLILTAVVFEEFYFRGYLIERVEEISGSTALGVGVGTILNLYMHSTYWSAPYLVSIAFDQLSLALLYLWRRSIITCVIAHLFLDAPFLFAP
jgi:membrane protease YdiL (CAAX protease family)